MHSMCAPRVTRQMSRRYSHSRQTLSSMPCVTLRCWCAIAILVVSLEVVYIYTNTDKHNFHGWLCKKDEEGILILLEETPVRRQLFCDINATWSDQRTNRALRCDRPLINLWERSWPTILKTTQLNPMNGRIGGCWQMESLCAATIAMVTQCQWHNEWDLSWNDGGIVLACENRRPIQYGLTWDRIWDSAVKAGGITT